MINQFNIGDGVCINFMDFCGKIVSIDTVSDKLSKMAGFEKGVLLYKIQIHDHYYITTTEDALEQLKPERVSE